MLRLSRGARRVRCGSFGESAECMVRLLAAWDSVSAYMAVGNACLVWIARCSMARQFEMGWIELAVLFSEAAVAREVKMCRKGRKRKPEKKLTST